MALLPPKSLSIQIPEQTLPHTLHFFCDSQPFPEHTGPSVANQETSCFLSVLIMLFGVWTVLMYNFTIYIVLHEEFFVNYYLLSVFLKWKTFISKTQQGTNLKNPQQTESKARLAQLWLKLTI